MKRVAVIGTGFRPIGSADPPAEIRRWISPDVDARLVEIRDGVFPASPAAVRQLDQQYLDAGIKAERDGFDAIYLNTIGDYGISQLRDMVSVPVVGAGDTAFRAAAAIAPFAIVTIWPPSMNFIPSSVLERCRVAVKCAGIINLSSDESLGALHEDENFVTELRACSIESLEKLRTLSRKAVDSGAGVIVYGCTCMAPAVDALGRVLGVPVIEPMSFGYRVAEHCARQGILATDVDFGAASAWLA